MNVHWSTKRVVFSGECGESLVMRPDALSGWVQDVAEEHASLLGFGYESCRERGMAWVEHRLDVLVHRWPLCGEEIMVETWTHAHGAVKALRDFRMTDREGKAVILVSSQWVLIDVSGRRPVSLKKHVPALEFKGEPPLVQETGESDMPAASRFVKRVPVNASHIDANGHVNNGVYLRWALESIPVGGLNPLEVRGLHIEFKRETLPGEDVEVFLAVKGKHAELSLVGQGVERARIFLRWMDEE